MSSTPTSSVPSPSPARATPDRAAELAENLAEIRSRIDSRFHSVLHENGGESGESGGSGESRESGTSEGTSKPLLVAVSKYKPASDVLACYEHGGQRDFGENYVQELVEKAKELPQDIRWHFIGTFQTNKAKLLASIPNLYALQTLSSTKGASALNKALPASREREMAPLNVLLQVNTSGEDVKSGLPPLTSPVTKEEEANANANSTADSESTPDSELLELALHVLDNCPRLRLQGLMTIGSLSESLSSTDENRDFNALIQTRDRLEEMLRRRGKWEDGRRLLVSMGMSSDFEAAVRAGSDIVRVGTGVFGERRVKGEN